MPLKPLSQENDVEFIVTSIGNAVLLHRGPLQRDYSWVQLDRDNHSLQFITEEGDIQDLGMRMHPPFEKNLRATKELILVMVDENNVCSDPRFLKFTGMVQ
ncbi:MAG TPA: hypothetical protein PKX38_06345 [Alphaproteobacteria bacterium]|nr:hypothetical protein [Micavibrio sp.]MBK9562698.1 hypothetical protein [Micavibrio sp.]HQX27540.1 hypothetical protein [Alphaproteobacteria bacterium]